MKAIVQDRYGARGGVLRLVDTDKPAARDGEVLIEVHAAGVDQGVWHAVAGKGCWR